MYSGNLGLCQNLPEILEAARYLQHRPDIRFVFVGDGVLKTRLQADAHRWDLNRVHFLPPQPKARLAQSLSAADLHLVPLDARVYQYLMPSKLYGALASGTAVLAVGPSRSELCRVVEDHRVGWHVAPGDPCAIAQCIARCADDRQACRQRGERARALAEDRFTRRCAVGKLSEILASMVHTGGSTAWNALHKDAPVIAH